MGWHQSKSLSELLPGDICFTTPNSEGHFTHAYIFMGWVEQKKFDYAYVCDNQSYDYGTTLHIRNIKNTSRDKDPFYFSCTWKKTKVSSEALFFYNDNQYSAADILSKYVALFIPDCLKI